MMMQLAVYLGYLASIFVVSSFIFKDLKKVRTINLLGCICFVIYGFFSEEDKILLPIIIPNAVLACMQVYFLLKDK